MERVFGNTWQGAGIQMEQAVMEVMANLKFVDGVQQVNRAILRVFRDDLKARFDRAKEQIELRAKYHVERQLFISDEYIALTLGELKGLFGLVDPVERLARIVKNSIETINVFISPPKLRSTGAISGTIKVVGMEKNAAHLLSNDEAVLITEKDERLEWLRILLFDGISIKRDFAYVPLRGLGRTKMGIMLGSTKGWFVFPQFAGTKDDNWISRSVDRAVPAIQRAMVEEIFG